MKISNYIKFSILVFIIFLLPKEVFVSGIIVEKYIIDNVCVFVKVGLRVQKGDPDMIKRAYESNQNRIRQAKEKAKTNAIKTHEILMSLIKQHKLKEYFGKMPKDYDDYSIGSAAYNKFPEKIIESNADDFTSKECIYSFLLEEIKSNTEILLYFDKLPGKNIRDIIVNTVKNKIRKDEAVALVIEYIRNNNQNDKYILEPFTIDELDSYWDVYFEEKSENGKQHSKCIFRVNKAHGYVERIVPK